MDQFPRSTALLGGHPIHPMLVPFPIAFLVGALLTDIGYVMWGGKWAYASTWLIAAGIAAALLAALFGPRCGEAASMAGRSAITDSIAMRSCGHSGRIWSPGRSGRTMQSVRTWARSGWSFRPAGH